MITKDTLYRYLYTTYPARYQREASLEAWLIRYVCSDSGVSPQAKLLDIVDKGCMSGAVGPVIYTSDCIKLHDRYEASIWDLVAAFRKQSGQTLGQFIDRFNLTIQDNDTLKVAVCWFAIEQLADKLLNHFLKWEVVA